MAGSWIYDDNYQLLQQGQGTGSASFAYDNAGNLIRKTDAAGEVTEFIYDTANRVREARLQGQLLARYGYDPAGRRNWKEQFRSRDGVALLPAQRSYYLYGDEGLLAEARQAIVLNADGSTTAAGAVAIVTQYGPTPDSSFTSSSLFTKTKDSNNEDRFAYFIHDQRGAPVQAIDKLGHIVWAARYDTFGRATIISPAATPDLPTIELSLRLPGQVEDAETGLHYNWHRTYDPSTGRYLERDPAGLAGGLNPYQYVFGNPTTLVDPLGKFWALPLIPLLPEIGVVLAPLAPFVLPAVVLVGGATCILMDACREWVHDRWNKIFPGYDTEVGPGGCPPPTNVHMNEQDGAPSNGDGGKNSDKPVFDDKSGTHILDGDETGGGHRSGTGHPGKSEFPSNWSDDKVEGEVTDIAHDPNTQWSKPDSRGYVSGSGTRDGVEIKVVVDTRNNRIVTGYPTNLPKNPK